MIGALVPCDPGYAELHCLSDFSFGRGASSARELFIRAKAQGYKALAITDECSLAGIVRALEASEATGLPLVVGSEFRLACGLRCVLLVEDEPGYRRLCTLITRGRRAAGKGGYHLSREDFSVLDGGDGLLCLWIPGEPPDTDEARFLQATFPSRTWLAVELHRNHDDRARLHALLEISATLGLPALASGDVHMHERSRRPVQDTLVALRHHLILADAGPWLFPNGERHLRGQRALAAIYPMALRAESVAVAARCQFNLRRLTYTHPRELVPTGHTPTSWLAELTWRGARERWPRGTPEKVRRQLQMELALIAELGYEAFFLTVHDIVAFARGRNILCQGRGSAANSAVCFALGITAVDPARAHLLFGRFLSRERKEPPDIDVDFEHERREEVLQYIYTKYGRERAALAATVITWGPRSAVRAVGAVFGMEGDMLDLLARAVGHSEEWEQWQARCRERNLDPEEPRLARLLAVAFALLGHPRHLSQHVGGFVISDGPLHALVPVENAAMPGRTIIQWDKDDLETLGLLKVDCLALGMLTAIRKCLDLLRRHGRGEYTLATLPPEDPSTYAMIRRADTVGVFQIESRAQMAMLSRLKPCTFYDLVIEVTIVRPGPIEGGMVHPYLRRRQGQEPVTYASPALERVLSRTLGVPLFQEQVIEIAMVAAGYTPGEADELRRSMAAWKRHGTLETHRQRLLAGMAERGYPRDFAERIFEQVRGFGSYGFPESHAASFALLTYASCWLKCHEPAAFLCALLNAQPLGFYTPSQLVQDARRHGIIVRPVDVRCSDHDHTLEPWPSDAGRQPALRLGLRQISGWPEAASERLLAARQQAPFRHVEDLCRRAQLDAGERHVLAAAGALKGLAGHRHRAHWESAAVRPDILPLFPEGEGVIEARVALPLPSEAADILADHAQLGLTLGRHPLALLRSPLRQRGYRSAGELGRMGGGRHARAAGLVTLRQRPETANGTTFLTLEDETGTVNVIVWRRVAERQRLVLLDTQLLGVSGRWECSQGVNHLVAGRLETLDPLLATLAGGQPLRMPTRLFR